MEQKSLMRVIRLFLPYGNFLNRLDAILSNSGRIEFSRAFCIIAFRAALFLFSGSQFLFSYVLEGRCPGMDTATRQKSSHRTRLQIVGVIGLLRNAWAASLRARSA